MSNGNSICLEFLAFGVGILFLFSTIVLRQVGSERKSKIVKLVNGNGPQCKLGMEAED